MFCSTSNIFLNIGNKINAFLEPRSVPRGQKLFYWLSYFIIMRIISPHFNQFISWVALVFSSASIVISSSEKTKGARFCDHKNQKKLKYINHSFHFNHCNANDLEYWNRKDFCKCIFKCSLEICVIFCSKIVFISVNRKVLLFTERCLCLLQNDYVDIDLTIRKLWLNVSNELLLPFSINIT